MREGDYGMFIMISMSDLFLNCSNHNTDCYIMLRP